MALVLPPSVDHFNSLPDITESNKAFQNRCTPKLLSDICAVFLKQRVQNIYGLVLVHQHFDLESDEKWAFSGEGVIPYEFFTDGHQIDMNQHYDSIHELGKLIYSSGLCDNLGVCSLDSIASTSKGPTMEFTSGRANITLPFDIDPEDGQSVEVAWQVHEGSIPGTIGFAQCKSRCKTGPNTGHQGRHLPTRN